MILQVDVGNTRLHWRVIERSGGDVLVRQRGASTMRHTVPKAVTHWPVTRIEVACVSAEVVRAPLLRTLEEKLGARVFEVETGSREYGLVNSYSNPGAMGVDR